MRNHEHSEDCIAATGKWAPRMNRDYDKATALLPTVIREDPDAVVAWFTCPDVTHTSARLAFKIAAFVMPLAAPVLARIQ